MGKFILNKVRITNYGGLDVHYTLETENAQSKQKSKYHAELVKIAPTAFTTKMDKLTACVINAIGCEYLDEGVKTYLSQIINISSLRIVGKNENESIIISAEIDTENGDAYITTPRLNLNAEENLFINSILVDITNIVKNYLFGEAEELQSLDNLQL